MRHEQHDEYNPAIALRAVRLRMLQRELERAERKGDIRLGALLLKCAAKEMGRNLSLNQPEISALAMTVIVLG